MGEKAIPTGVTVFLDRPPTDQLYVIPPNVLIMYATILHTIRQPHCVIRVSTVKALVDPLCPIRKGQEVYAVQSDLVRSKPLPSFDDGTRTTFQTSF